MHPEQLKQPDHSIESLFKLYTEIREKKHAISEAIEVHDELADRIVQLNKELLPIVISGAGIKEYASSMGEEVDAKAYKNTELRHNATLIGIQNLIKRRDAIFPTNDAYEEAKENLKSAEEAEQNVRRLLKEKGVHEDELDVI